MRGRSLASESCSLEGNLLPVSYLSPFPIPQMGHRVPLEVEALEQRPHHWEPDPCPLPSPPQCLSLGPLVDPQPGLILPRGDSGS